MNTSMQHPSSNPAEPDAGVSRHATELRSELVSAVVVAVLLLAGLVVGGSLAARKAPLLPQPTEASGAQPSLEFDYFPSHYVNQGVESSAEIPTF